MNYRLIAFIKDNLTLGARLSELFYGVMMVVIITGLINMGVPPTDQTLRFMLIAALAVNISWGIIDGVTGMYGGLANRADYYRIANEYRLDTSNPEKEDMVARSLQGTIVENLVEEEQAEVIRKIGTGKPGAEKQYLPSRSDWNLAIATIIIDIILVFPVVIPYFIIDNVRMAVFVSHTIAITLLACIAIIWAGKLNLSRVKAGIIIAVISFIVITFTYYIGW